MPARDKTSLRQQLRQNRRNITPADRVMLNRGAAELAASLPDWQQARRVGMYLAADHEFDPGDIAARCRLEGKQLYLPVIQPDRSLRFASWQRNTPMRSNRFGILEPDAVAENVETLDVLFMPLVGWDRRGTRLGMGGGFYDRTLESAVGPLKVGLGYAVQEVPSLPREPWDIALDYVITGESVIHTASRG